MNKKHLERWENVSSVSGNGLDPSGVLRSVLHQLSDVAGSQGWVLGSPVIHKSKGSSECGS